MCKCIIMCAGEYHRVPFEKKEGDLLIAADNGLSYLAKEGITPDLVIGDYDSLEGEGRKVFEDFKAAHPEAVITLPVEKDDTDTMAACRIGLERGYREFTLLAALGGRLDHTIANIQTLLFLKDHNANGQILDEKLSLRILRNERVDFTAPSDATFSLFALEHEIHHVSITGMQYELEGADMTDGFPIGCSNHMKAGQKGSVEVGDGTALSMLSWQ